MSEGIKANGLEDANLSAENEIGIFKCTAIVDGNIIKMTTTKKYRVDALTADKWPLMVEFLETAYG